MIPETEVPQFIRKHIPDICVPVPGTDEKGYIYKDMYALFCHTCTRIGDHNYPAVKKCFAMAERLYEQGSGNVRTAVENVYVYAFSNMLHRYREEQKEVLALIPITLYTLYINQLQARGC